MSISDFLNAAKDKTTGVLGKLDRGYDRYVHPAVMRAANAMGLGDSTESSTAWDVVKHPDGHVTRTQMRVSPPQDNDAYFKALGKTSLGVLGAGGLGALLVAARQQPTVPLASRTNLTVPLTAAEQKLLLSQHDLDKKRKQRKLGEVSAKREVSRDPNAAIIRNFSGQSKAVGPSNMPGKDRLLDVGDSIAGGIGDALKAGKDVWEGTGPTYSVLADGRVIERPGAGFGHNLRHNNPITRNFFRDGKKIAPAAKDLGQFGDLPEDLQKRIYPNGMPATDRPSAPPDASRTLFGGTPWALPLAVAAIVGAGGLGYMGVKSYVDRARKKKLLAQRERARERFLDALAAERETKVSSAIDQFVSACEEKFTVKEASGLDAFLATLGTFGVLGGGLGFYNGLNSEPGDLRKLRALRKARERQLAMQQEFELQVAPDIAFLPALPQKRLGQEVIDV